MTGPICLPLFQSLDLFCVTLPCCITLTLCLSGHRPILSSGTRCPCRVFVCFFDFWFILAKSKRTNWERHWFDIIRWFFNKYGLKTFEITWHYWFQSQSGTLACMTGPICLPLFQSLDLFCVTLPCCITLTLCLSGHRPILSSGTRCPCRVFVCFFDFWFILAKSKRTNWERHWFDIIH